MTEDTMLSSAERINFLRRQKYANDPEFREYTKTHSYKWRRQNLEKVNANARRYKKERRTLKRVWVTDIAAAIKSRCKRSGVHYELTPNIIESIFPANNLCPVFKTPFVFGRGFSPEGPSVDRLRPELGYVPGNIAIISHRANTMKQNCTDPEQFIRLAEWLRSALKDGA